MSTPKNIVEIAQKSGLNGLKELLRQNPSVDLNGIDAQGWTPLSYALAFRNFEAAQSLVEVGVDVNKKDGMLCTPLYRGVQSDNINIVKLLLDKGAKIDSETPEDPSPKISFEITAQNNNNHYSNQNSNKDSNQSNPIPFNKAPTYNKFSFSGKTHSLPNFNLFNDPLLLAFTQKNKEMCQLLLLRGANPHIRNRKGESIFHLAIENNFNDLIPIIASLAIQYPRENPSGKNRPNEEHLPSKKQTPGEKQSKLEGLIESRDQYNLSPLCKAVSSKNVGAVTMLLQLGASVNLPCGQEEQTPLHYAAANNSSVLIKILHDHGAQKSLNIRDANGATPLMHGLTSNKLTLEGGLTRPDAALDLMKLGANVNIPDNEGLTPLHIAAGCNHVNLTNKLISFGAKNSLENKENTTGDTPLLLAVKRGYVDSAIELIKSGADVNAQDNSKNNVTFWANYNGLTKLMQYIPLTTKVDAQKYPDNTNIRRKSLKDYKDFVQTSPSLPSSRLSPITVKSEFSKGRRSKILSDEQLTRVNSDHDLSKLNELILDSPRSYLTKYLAVRRNSVPANKDKDDTTKGKRPRKKSG